MPCCSLLLRLRSGDGSWAEATVAPLAGLEHRAVGFLSPGNMEAAAAELQAGSRIPVTIDQIINDTLVVTLSFRERSFTGILLDCNKKTGLFCVPDVTKNGDYSLSKPVCDVAEVLGSSEEPVSKSPSQDSDQRPKDENSIPDNDPACALVPVPTPVPAGQPPYPPYFEGAPFPQPLWVRHSYSQWVPQPPPRPMKRKRRRGREPGRMTMSTIRLRPRQVLCEKCKNSVNNSDEDSKDGVSNKSSRKENVLQSDEDAEEKELASKLARKEEVVGNKDTRRRENGTTLESKRLRRDKRAEPETEKFPNSDIIPHSPVIKISYSTPQGKGEVMKIPSRVHGSVKPFCPKQLVPNGLGGENGKVLTTKEQRHILDATRSGLTVSIPKLKLTRPYTTVGQDLPSPKIRLRPPQREGEDSVVEYEAAIVDGTRRTQATSGSCLPHSEDSGEGKNSLELWSGSSGEEGDRGHNDLTLLINFRKRKADSSSLSVCSSDSLDEAKSFSSEGTSPELCDLAPGEDLSVTSSVPTRDGCKTVPPLTVRLHTRSMTKCVTEEGHAVAVGDIVWGKIHGFPWWPARVLSISGTRKQETATCEAQWPQAKVSWFGSPTTSQLSVAKLSPFREFFRSRFNRKKKGMYRRAILEAAKAVGYMSPEITTLLSHCDT